VESVRFPHDHGQQPFSFLNTFMIRLLSTDFDGTLVEHDSATPVLPELFEKIESLRARGVKWAVNTGRSLWHMEEGLNAEYHFPIQPDYALVEERYLYRRDKAGKWEAFGDWNDRSTSDHHELFRLAEPLLAEVLAFLEVMPGTQPLYDSGRFIGAVTANDQQMDKLCAFLVKLRDRLPLFAFQRNTIYVRFCHCDYSKGTALGELSRLLDLSPDAIFAAGDHYNDLPMLDGRHARWVTCPSNSVEEVKLAVRTANGYLAKGVASAGVVEALNYFEANI